MARPKKQISSDHFESLCRMQCTEEEICAFLGVTDKTLVRWIKSTYKLNGFSEAFKRFSAGGKISLRRSQFKLAEKSAAMAIFLGKNYLGQKDDIEYEDTEALNKLDAILEHVADNAERKTK